MGFNKVLAKLNRRALHVAARASGATGAIFNICEYTMRHSIFTNIDNSSRPGDILETVRILVEKAKCDPMDLTPSMPGRGRLAAGTALHMYTGPAQALKYLLTQDVFVVDLGHCPPVGLSVIEAHLYVYFPHSASTTRLLLDHNREMGRDTASVGWREQLLSGAIEKLCQLQYRLSGPDSRYSQASTTQIKQQMEWLMRDALRLKPNIHSADNNEKRTPFLQLTSNTWLHQEDLHAYLYERLAIWFEVLHEAGYDLRSYILEEYETLLSFGRGIEVERSRSGFVLVYRRSDSLSNSLHVSFERVMCVEQQTKTGDLVLYLEEEFVWSKEKPTRIAKRKDPLKEYVDDLYREPWDKQRVRFSIGALTNGKQRFSILDRSVEVIP